MDSIKTNLLEQQSSLAFPKKNTQRPFILSLIFLLTLIIAGMLTITTIFIIQESSPTEIYNSIPHSVTPSYSIIVACSFAPYKQLCHSALSSISTNTSNNIYANIYDDTYFSPETIIFYSFQLTVSQLSQLGSLHRIPKTKNTLESESAIQVCRVLLDKEVSQLNTTVASTKNLYMFTELEVNEHLDRFKKMEMYQQSCLDMLEKSKSELIKEIRLNVQETGRYMSNSRAILLNRYSILDKIYGSPSIGVDRYSYSYFYEGLSYEYMIFFVVQYIFLIGLLIVMLKLY